ncbi:MAG: glycosyltransferase [Nitrospinae bacterium]|nr:glycosyltransferase [Nitrospinota bacterium]
MKILTFNWHEAYICSLSKTGHQFEILERFKGGSKIWFYNTRTLPQNAVIVKERDAFDRLSSGYYDIVICHNMKDLSEIKDYPLPKVLIFHNRLTTELALAGNKYTKEEYLKSVKEFIKDIKDLHLIFISKIKMDDWGLVGSTGSLCNGDVITPGIDLAEYHGYHGSEQKVLRVGNFMKRRDIMMGYSIQEKILAMGNGQWAMGKRDEKEIPSTLLGINDPLDGGRFTESWDDLKECYRSHRVYLNTTADGFEDGYNLSCLEAMATGMPVVSIANKTSPIIDGYNGYISGDTKYLSEKIKYLLTSSDEAVRLGVNARKTVERDFNISDFVKKWNGVFEKARGQGVKGSRGQVKIKIEPSNPRILEPSNPKFNILLAYVSYPVTTARYMEESLNKFHNVVTCGPSIGQDIVRLWNLENMREEVKSHDISCSKNVSIDEILKKLPHGFMPDLFLWIESVYGYFPQGIQKLSFPTACYMIDSHLNLSWHLDWAKQFDFVFVAQKKYIPDFKNAGCRNVHWLPLGCDPGIHKKFDVEKVYDIGFVGSITKNHVRRKMLLDKLSRYFNVHIERSFLKDMALTFSRSKIIFNEAIKDDLNMRVFEALSTGSLLFTDNAKESGLTDFFKDREHLVIYNDENIVELADYYLTHPKEREAIAEKGREEVLKWHTYDHRIKEMVENIFSDQWSVISGQESKKLTTHHSPLNTDLDDPLLLEALKQIEDKNYDGAFKNFTFALSGRELNTIERFTMYMSLGECNVRLGKLNDGIGFYKNAKEIDPKSEKPYIDIGDVYINEGRYGDAVVQFKDSIRLNSENDTAFYGLGISLCHLNRIEEGYEMFKIALDINIDNMPALDMLLKYSNMLDRFDISLKYLLRYLELHPANLDMLYALGSLYFKTGRYEDTADAVEKILLFNPGHSKALELMEKCQSIRVSKCQSINSDTLTL